jgi:hypothetical protein
VTPLIFWVTAFTFIRQVLLKISGLPEQTNFTFSARQLAGLKTITITITANTDKITFKFRYFSLVLKIKSPFLWFTAHDFANNVGNFYQNFLMANHGSKSWTKQQSFFKSQGGGGLYLVIFI